MKSSPETHPPKIWPPHLTYSAFSLAPRVKAPGFLNLIAVAEDSHSFCPVKHKRALLKSNPPRDNWTDGDKIKSVSTFGEAKPSPNSNPQTFISEPEHAFQNLSKIISKSSNTLQMDSPNKKYYKKSPLARTRFFEASAPGAIAS